MLLAMWACRDNQQLAFELATLAAKEMSLKFEDKGEDSDEEVQRVMDADAILQLREIKNEYAVSAKGKWILKTQRRGFYGHDRDQAFREEYVRRQVRIKRQTSHSDCTERHYYV